jgi:hypothetical protein
VTKLNCKTKKVKAIMGLRVNFCFGMDIFI